MNIKSIFLGAAVILLAGCVTNASHSQKWPPALVGTFYVQTGDRRTEIVSNGDGSFSSLTTIAGKEAWTTAGEWWVSDGKLHGIYHNASISDFPIGEVDTSDLIEVTRDYHVIKNRNGVIKKYQRLR